MWSKVGQTPRPPSPERSTTTMASPVASRRRRALRDVIPATLATGAAGLVVALVVGGATQGIQSALVPGERDLPAYAAELAAGATGVGADGVTVDVRAARPRSIGITAAFDLLPPGAVAEDVAVRGAFLQRDAASIVASAPPAPATA